MFYAKCRARLGSSHSDLIHSSIGELITALDDWSIVFNLKQQGHWERVRFNVFNLVNIQLKKKDRYKKVTDLVRFHWEGKIKKKKPSKKADAHGVFDRLDKFRKKLKNG